jgi:hypothetical protein
MKAKRVLSMKADRVIRAVLLLMCGLLYRPAVCGEIQVVRGPFKVSLDTMGRGNIYYRGKPVFDGFEPIPYMRNANYSAAGVPEEVQVVEKKEEKANRVVVIVRGGNPAYMTNLITITVVPGSVTIDSRFSTPGNVPQVGVGCRYYINRDFWYKHDVEVTGGNGKTVKKVLGDNLPNWLEYGVKGLAVHEPEGVLGFRLTDQIYWYLQNLQPTYRTKTPHYLLTYELRDWKPNQKKAWHQTLVISVSDPPKPKLVQTRKGTGR